MVYNRVSLELINPMENPNLPERYKPVLAKIERISFISESASECYEVVYHNGVNWMAYGSSDVFDERYAFDGTSTVLEWRYCHELFN